MNIRRNIKIVMWFVTLFVITIGMCELSSQDPVKLFLHHDRNLYLAGEEIWLKAILFREVEEGQESEGVLLAELTGTDAHPLIQEVLRTTRGAAAGTFTIPETATTGTYTLRVYSRTDEQTGIPVSISSVITIINPYEPVRTNRLPIPDPAATEIIPDSFRTIDSSSPGFFDIKAFTRKKEYGYREQVELVIRSYDNLGRPVPAHISVAVVKKGTRAPAAISSRALVLPSEVPDIKEVSGILITGKITHENQRISVAGVPVYLAIPSSGQIQRVLSGENGRFSFSITDVEGERDIYLAADQKAGQFQVQIDRQFDTTPGTIGPEDLQPDTSLRAIIDDLFIAHQSRLVFQQQAAIVKNETGPSGPFYSEEDATFVLSDFIELPNMEEVLRELIKDVLVLGTTRSRSIEVVDRITNRTLGPDPCILIDGLPVTDQEILFQMDPGRVDRIHVVNSRYILGGWIMDGIIDIRSEDGYHDEEVRRGFLKRTYTFYNIEKIFNLPNHEGSSSYTGRIPDFRNTLYWNPGVNTGQEGEISLQFPASDEPGLYEVSLAGITPDGKCAVAVIHLHVVAK